MKFSGKEILGGVILLIIVCALLLNLYLSNSKTEFCGNGVCSKSEEGVCKLDCNWCGDGICNSNECDTQCNQDCSLSQCENRKCEPEKGETCLNTPNDCRCLNGYCDAQKAQCVYQSCGNSICDENENSLTCPNDCKGNSYEIEDMSDINYPIIFVHGHSRTGEGSQDSINHFKEFQEKLAQDNYVGNKGIILPRGTDLAEGSLSKTEKPVSFRTTYYLSAYDQYGSYVGQEDNQPISVYAQRLGEVVDDVLRATGKNKVKIVAHSMGGLVARDYVKNQGGLNRVDTLITIGTPNHGVYADIATNCEDLLFGGNEASPECNDLRAGSLFLLNLNSGDETVGEIKYMTIRGEAAQGSANVYGWTYDVCNIETEYHDEVVCTSSIVLNGATNQKITGQEVDGREVFHNYLIEPSRTPQAYNTVVDFLRN